ncbi:MAG: malonyl-CoA synthase [Pseudomonadota bacterium]
MANPLFDTLFARHAGSTAPFLHLPGERGVDYASFLADTAQIAHALADLGLKPGDRLAAQVVKSPRALALYAACVQAGVVFLPLNPGYTRAEIGYFLTDSDAALFVCDPAKAPPADARTPVETLDADGGGTLAEMAVRRPTQFPTAARKAEDLAALLYTSGTTGRPKGAMLSQTNLLSNAAALTDLWRFTADDVLLHALPIFHTHGLFVATNVTLTAGGAMIFLPRFDLDAMFDAFGHATALMGVPTFYTRLLSDPRLTRAAVAHMRLFISGSAPLLEDTHSVFASRTGHAILERYGMTETNMTTSNPYDGPRRPGTVGRPLPGVQVRLANADAPRAVGQVEVRGPNVFQGYWRMPDKTAAEFTADGFFQTGDLGQFDADGYLRIVGRAKDLIISGGFNIYPKEIEAVLDAQPGIAESAVIGVPHADFGETPVGLLVPEPGAKPDLDAILAAAGTELARFKLPRRLIVVDGLPRNAMGKVQKNVLRAQHKDVFGA